MPLNANELASIQSKLFDFFLKLIQKKRFLKFQLATGKFDLFDCPEPPPKIAASCHIDKNQVNGRNVFTLRPRQKGSGKHILYLHGGAYVQNFKRPHWQFLAYLVKELNCTITAPDYPLAPAFTYADAFAMVVPLYQELISSVHAENLILMGDSAGGGFALALAQKMKLEGTRPASQVILLSPWLDLTLTNPDIVKIDPLDAFLEVESLQQAGKAYAGSTRPDHYLLSPINGPLTGLGKISLFIGSNDILLADARKFKTLAETQGIYLNYYEYPGMAHVWMLLNFPESQRARHQIIGLIQHA